MNKRLRVLLIPDRMQWVLGTIAKNIVKYHPQFDFTVLSQGVIEKYPSKFNGISASYDLIHYLSPHAYLSVSRIVGNEACVVTTIHHVVDWSKIEINTQSDAIMVVSNEWKKYLISKGVLESKITVVSSGVDTDLFKPVEERERIRIRNKLNIAPHLFLIGFFAKSTSNDSNRKGVDIFLSAIGSLKGVYNSIAVLIVGPGWDSLIKEFRNFRVQTAYVRFAPERDMPKLFGSLDCYWITSRIEGGPITLLEAMSCGIPVITTSVGIAKDIVNHGENAFVVPQNDSDGFVKTSLELIFSRALRGRIGAEARNTILNGYQWCQSLRTIPLLYNSALRESKGHKDRSNKLTERADEYEKINSNLKIEEELVWADEIAKMGAKGAAFKIILFLCFSHPIYANAWKALIKILLKR
jgi:glycosyltransferase involved in cell wall biosynthesis